MYCTNKPTEKNGIIKSKHKTSGFCTIDNDLCTQQKTPNTKLIDKNRDIDIDVTIETGCEKNKKYRNKELKEAKKEKNGNLLQNNVNNKALSPKKNNLTTGKVKESKSSRKKYKHKTIEISNDLIDQIKKKIEMKKFSKTNTKEQSNIFQTKFPGNENDCKSESITNEIVSYDGKDNNSRNLERKKSIRNETCMEVEVLKKQAFQKNLDKNKILFNQSSYDKKKFTQNFKKKIHRYAMYDCREEYEKYKKSYMFPNNKNNNWQIYDFYGNPWWSKFKAGPLSKLSGNQKNDEDTTDDSLVINTQAILQVKEKRLVYYEPQEEDGFSDVFGPIKDLALCNDTQYGKTKVWWISLRNVIQMNLLVSKGKKVQLKENCPKVKKLEGFNEKDPITVVRYIKGSPKKQQVTQQIIKHIPVRDKVNGQQLKNS